MQVASKTVQRVLRTYARIRLALWRENPIQQKMADSKDNKIGPRTLNHYFEALRSFCRWCVKRKRMPTNPVVSVEKAEQTTDVRRERRADFHAMRHACATHESADQTGNDWNPSRPVKVNSGRRDSGTSQSAVLGECTAVIGNDGHTSKTDVSSDNDRNRHEKTPSGKDRVFDRYRMRPLGVEPSVKSAIPQVNQQVTQPGAAKASAALCPPMPADAELQTVLNAWPTLPAPLKAAIMALVGTVGGGRRNNVGISDIESNQVGIFPPAIPDRRNNVGISDIERAGGGQ